MAQYAMHREIDGTYEDTLERVKATLKEEGFGVLTEIDVRATLAEKLGQEFRKYKILGACNPPLAHQALSAELDLGVLLPCNVVVWEQDDGKAMIAAMDPQVAMGSLVDNPGIKDVAGKVRERIQRALDNV